MTSEASGPVDELKRWDRTELWHAFTQMQDYEPFVIERAEGCYLYDIEGHRYLDAESSLWCNVHGHRHPLLDQAIRDQLDRVAHVTLLGMSCDTTVRLSHELVQRAPGDLNHVFFSSDGACANEVALKLAYQYWRHVAPGSKRDKFLCLDAAYHGDTIGTVSVGGVDRFNRVFEPLLFDTLRGPLPDTYRLPEGVSRENACDFYLDTIESLLAQQAESLAAVIVEPLVQCAAGIVTHPTGFLAGLAERCRRFDVLLIADEIAVGFGRTGALFACEKEAVIPDFLCLGKGLTGGYLPMSATLASTRIWDAFLGDYAQSNAFFHGHTYGGNPLAAAVAMANLKLFDQPDFHGGTIRKGERLAQGLAHLDDHPNVGNIRRSGLIAGIELVADKASKRPFHWREQVARRVCRSATARGVWLRQIEDTIVVMPPLVISDSQIDEIVATLQAAILDVLPV